MAFTPAANAARYTPVSTIPVPGTHSAAPSPAYSGVFIPQIWSSKLVEKFYDATVLEAIANTDYEGEIQNSGDTVIIRTRPDINIYDYVPDQSLTIERPSASTVTLEIDQAHYFNLMLDDIYRTQSDLDLMNLWAMDASEAMKIKVDTNVLAAAVTAPAADNLGLTAGRISGAINLGVTGTPVNVVSRGASGSDVDIVDFILRMAQTLDEQNVPENGRFLIIPAWASTMIKTSELRDASLTGDSMSTLRNGKLGRLDRFDIYMSNLMPNPGVAGEDYFFAGNKMGMTFAAQLTKMQTLESEFTFGRLMRGLFVYGFEAIKDTCITSGVVTHT